MIQPGSRLAHYEIVSALGKGGMGEVWRARDTKLGREVAIKTLPEEFAQDADRLARFEREAQLLASLNHPNIAAIYGLEEHEGSRFLVLELVEGDTLADQIKSGRLPVGESLKLALQIAEALAAAHEKGVVHRDLKPANIKVTPDGRVKVLDFGLAKAFAGDQADVNLSSSPTLSMQATRAGVILGTPAYMSPEQARGQSVDRRTDVWAFGCVLYEMLTGASPFQTENMSDTVARILERAPNWSSLPSVTPDATKRLLRKCLEKDVRNRWRDLGDAGLELRESLSPSQSVNVAKARAGWSPIRVGLGLALLLGAVALISWVLSVERLPQDLLADATFTSITNFDGDEFDADISPDGRLVTFVGEGEDVFDVWLSPIDTGNVLNLSDGQLGDVRGPAELRSIGFSAEGSEIWVGGGPSPRRMRLLPVVGGSSRNFLGDEAINVDWSPDGTRVVYHTREEGDPIYVADANGANDRLILDSEAGQHQHFPVWSYDGEWIYLTRGQPSIGEMSLWRIRPGGEDLEILTDDKLDVRYPTPIDDAIVLYVAREENGAGPWLWALDTGSKESRRVTSGLQQYTSVSSSSDGQSIAVSVASPQANLWTVPILDDEVATEEDVTPYGLPSPRALAPRFGPDGVFYLSSRGTGDGLWRFQGGEAEEIWNGAGAALLAPGAVSPDGSRVALVPRREALLNIEIVRADGAESLALIDSIDVRGAPSWSPDGESVVTGGVGPNGQGLFRISVAGGEFEELASGQALNPVWSPNDDLIVYAGQQVEASAPVLAVRSDGSPVRLPEIRVLRGGERFRFLPDGSGLVYMQGALPEQDFWLLDFETMTERRLTSLGNFGTMKSFDVTPDGTEIVFDRTRQNSDIVLIERGERTTTN